MLTQLSSSILGLGVADLADLATVFYNLWGRASAFPQVSSGCSKLFEELGCLYDRLLGVRVRLQV